VPGVVAVRRTFALPDVGEGLQDGEVVRWLVGVGDIVAVNQPVVEVETAKAVVELPCPWAGRVTALLVDPGVVVPVGRGLLEVETSAAGDVSGAGPAPVPDSAPSVAPSVAPHPVVASAPADGYATPGDAADLPSTPSLLVGYGVRPGSVRRRPRRGPVAVPSAPQPTGGEGTGVRATPPVRRLARELGVPLARVPGSGPGGRVTRADVTAVARGTADAPAGAAAGSALELAVPAALHGAVAPREHRVPLSGVRRSMAAAMVASAFTAPHVTEWVTVDVTRTVKLAKRLRDTPGFVGTHPGPLLLAARALVGAARRHPEVNAALVDDATAVVYRDYVHLGIATDTARGLVVPVLKDADSLSLPELAAALRDLVERARAGAATPADLAGGTITLTNVGVFGVDGGTPILPPGQTAILAVGAFRRRPWVHKGSVKPRWVAELALSFDHRLVDGATGSRFLADVAAVLTDPSAMLGW